MLGITELSPVMTLSDEVLMMILELLPTPDLIRTSRACRRLNRLCMDKKLLRHLINPPDDYESMSIIFQNCINADTKELSISSQSYPNKGGQSSLSPSMLLQICPNYSYLRDYSTPKSLTTLKLIRQIIDGRILKKAIMLPSTLKTLDMSGTLLTNITEESHWFQGMNGHFTQLEELTFKFCSWVTTHALLAISKIPQLKSLDLEGCRNVGDSIPYCSLACFNGFHKLERLNLNNTNVRNSDFQSFCRIPNLVEFYLGEYDMVQNQRSLTVWDSSLGFYIPEDCKNLKVVDISGCYFTRTTDDLRHQTLINLLYSEDTVLEKVIAHVMVPIPPHVIQAIKTKKPKLQISQAPFI